MKAMMGAGGDGGAATSEAGGDDLFAQMMGAGVDAGAADAAKEAGKKASTEDDLFNQMMNAGH